MKCPKCEAKIDELEHIRSGWKSDYVFLNNGDDLDYERKTNFEADGEEDYYACIECGYKIADDEYEAIDILKDNKDEGE